MTAPLLEATAATVAVDGVPALRLDLRTQGAHVLWIGDADAFIAALGDLPLQPYSGRGIATVSAGSLHLDGRDVARGAHVGHVGLAPGPDLLPLPDERVGRWLGWAARLRGASRSAARILARAALDRLDLGVLARQRISRLTPLQRRGCRLALAVLGAPDTVVLVRPLDGLGGDDQSMMIDWLGRATEGRRSIVTTAGQSSIVTLLGRDATDVLVARRGEVVALASPQSLHAGRRLYLVEIDGERERFVEALDPSIEVSAGNARFFATLPVGATASALLHAAHTSDTALLSCVPVLDGA